MSWPVVKLGEVATLQRDGIGPAAIESGTRYLGLEHIEAGGRIIGGEAVESGDLASTKFRFGPEHVLYGKLRPYLAKIALPDFSGVCSTDILPVLPSDRLDRRYLAYFLRQPDMVEFANGRATGANLPRLSPKSLASFEIPLPPLAEQRRIAAILDQAARLTRLRAEALARLDTLGQAIFHEMFGDPISMAFDASCVDFSDACSDETSKSPKIQKTDYAASGEIPVVDQGQKKIAGYTAATNACRTPGPIILFGDHTRVVKFIDFPFAIGADGAKILKPSPLYAPRFFAALLARLPIPDLGYSRHMREVKKLRFPVPDMDRQLRFSERMGFIAQQESELLGALKETQTLFASLQHRAFRGEL